MLRASAGRSSDSGPAKRCQASVIAGDTALSTGRPETATARKASVSPPRPASCLPNLLKITRSAPLRWRARHTHRLAPARLRRDCRPSSQARDPARRAERYQVAEIERRHRDAARRGEHAGNPTVRLGKLVLYALDNGTITKQRVMERHGAADHRWIGIMAQNDAIAGRVEMHGDRRGDLVGAEHESERLQRLDSRGGEETVGHGGPGNTFCLAKQAAGQGLRVRVITARFQLVMPSKPNRLRKERDSVNPILS